MERFKTFWLIFQQFVEALFGGLQVPFLEQPLS